MKLDTNEKIASSSTEEFLALARERFKLAEEAESEQRRRELEDWEFRAGKQWPDDIKGRRERGPSPRPCLTMDRTGQFIHQVSNEQRQQKPSPKVSPVDDNADVDTAEVFQGIYRQIERQSNAGAARAWAAEAALTVGRGYYRIVTEYLPKSFDQDIFIRRIKYQSSVYFDPTSQEPDGSDAGFVFIVNNMPKREYKQKYPKSELAGLTEFESIGDRAPGWVTSDSVRVAEYFRVEKTLVTLCLLDDGSTAYEHELPGGAFVIERRQEEIRTVKWSLINAVEELDSKDWPGEYIPIIRVVGEELVVNGETQYSGMIKSLKDGQRQFNYMRSAQVEAIALAPKAPYMAAAGQVEEFPEWRTLNTENHAVMRYKPVGVNGTVMGAPQRQVFEPAIQAITMAVQQSSDDMKASVGIYDASLGARSNETSGRAINARKVEGDTANFHYVDNLNTAINFEAKQVIRLIQIIYDRPGRIARMLGEDGTEKQVTLNQPFAEGKIQRIYDLNAGRYDVAVNMGPSYSTKRQEASEGMLNLAGADPTLMQKAGDIIVKNLDFPGSQEMSERLRKTLPPGLADDEEQPIPPQAQAQMAQMGQLIEALTAQVNEQHSMLEQKRLELESKERIATLQAQVELIKTEATINAQQAQTLLKAEMEALNRKMDMQHQAAVHDSQQSFQAEQAEKQAQALGGAE